MPDLTKKQRAILDYMIKFVRENGYQPSYREMMAEFGFASPNGISCHIKVLEDKGYIQRHVPPEARAIRILRWD